MENPSVLLFLVIIFLPLLCSGIGLMKPTPPTGTAWRFLCFAFCVLTLLAMFGGVPAFFSFLGSFVCWLIAWVFCAVSRSAISRHNDNERLIEAIRQTQVHNAGVAAVAQAIPAGSNDE